jgi:hypothetical protein
MRAPRTADLARSAEFGVTPVVGSRQALAGHPRLELLADAAAPDLAR